MSEFREAIKNAADWEGVPHIEVNPAYTSKTCSAFAYLNKDLMTEKKWVCPECGVVHDRDENADKNLRNMGQQFIESLKKGA